MLSPMIATMFGTLADERLILSNELTLEDNVAPTCNESLVEPRTNLPKDIDPHIELAQLLELKRALKEIIQKIGHYVLEQR